MKRVAVVVAGFIVFAAASSLTLDAQAQRGWTTLFDGKNIDAFNKVGDANWTIADGVLQADKGMNRRSRRSACAMQRCPLHTAPSTLPGPSHFTTAITAPVTTRIPAC